MTTFGRAISDDLVEDAVLDVLKRGLPTYLGEIENQRGLTRGFYQRPKTYEVKSEVEKLPEEQVPMILVVSTGLTGRPVKDGRGLYRVPWYIGVAGIVSADNKTNTRRMAYRYAAAIRTLLVNFQTLNNALDGSVRGVEWVDGRNNEIPPDGDRTLWLSRQVFEVEVGNVLDQSSGPLTLPALPVNQNPAALPPDPVITKAKIQTTITKEPLK